MKRPVFRSVLFALLFMGCMDADPASGPAPAPVADMGRADMTTVDMTTPPPTGLIKRVVYSDSFTINTVRRDGLHEDNSAGAYRVETSPDGAVWKLSSDFSFQTPGSSTDPLLLSAAQGNPSAVTGLAQSGGGDFSFAYNDPSGNYVVQADAIIPDDRFDISSMPFAGASLSDAGGLSIFFRRVGTGGYPQIGIFLGGLETDTGCATGITDMNWHNFAVNFDQGGSRVRMYVDRVLRCNLDLTTFAGGRYRSYAKAAVGMGGNGSSRASWMDNFQAGPG